MLAVCGGVFAGAGFSGSLIGSACGAVEGFPPVGTGGGISSSSMGFPFLTDANIDCRVQKQREHITDHSEILKHEEKMSGTESL